MNILVLIRWPVGGIRTYCSYAYEGWSHSQFNITVAAPDIDEIDSLNADLARMDIDLLRLPEPHNRREFLATVRGVLNGNDFDVVQTHGLTAGIAVAMNNKKKVKHIATLHDVVTKAQSRGIIGYGKRAALTYLAHKSDIVNCVGSDAADNLRNSLLSTNLSKSKKIIAINNGVNIDRIVDAQTRNLKKELGIEESVFVLGFFGRFMAQKGFRLLLRALQILEGQSPGMPYIVVTTGVGGFSREDKEFVKQCGLEDRFRFLPFERDLAPTLKGVDAIVMPSYWEAMPLLPMESLIAGTPVIGSDCIGLREVLQDTPCRCFPTGDPYQLARHIALEVERPSKAEVRDGLATWVKRFDSKNMALKLQKVVCAMSALE